MSDTPDTPAPDDDTAGTAALAARRRGKKAQTGPPAPVPGGTPAAVAGAVPHQVVASRTLVSAHLGAEGPPNATGGVFLSGRPLILEPQPTSAVALPDDADYVIAECDAEESMVPSGCITPISRTLWFKGYRIRRDLYEAVLAAHAAAVADGRATDAAPAQMPEGRDAVPATVLANPAPAVATPDGAPAAT